MMNENEYLWDGDWEGPGHGSYVIFKNMIEMEPGDVIDLINRLEEILEQLAHKVGGE